MEIKSYYTKPHKVLYLELQNFFSKKGAYHLEMTAKKLT